MITDDTIGLRTRPGDSDGLARAIEDLLVSSTAPRMRFAAAARRAALTVTDSNAIDGRLAEIYGSLAATHQQAVPGLRPAHTEGAHH